MTFDPLARTYDDEFTRTRTGAWLRARTHERMARLWSADSHILELGCGTGEDARFLAQRGVTVTATDASSLMLENAQQKNADLSRIEYALLDLTRLPQSGFDRVYDGVLANFGALNAVSDWQAFGAWLAPRVKRDGVIAFGVMGRFCVWEILWHSVHLNPRTAFRRLSGSARFHDMSVYYPTPRQITQALKPHFRRDYLQPLGVFLPPSDVYGMIERRPHLYRALIALETRSQRFSALAWLADHFWIELRRSLDHEVID